MRRSWNGRAVALGLYCALSPVTAALAQHSAGADDAQLRFVADPVLLHSIDPAVAAGAPRLPTVIRLPDQPVARPVPAASVTVTTPNRSSATPPAAIAEPIAPANETQSWPVTLKEVHAERAAKAGSPEVWSPAEVDAARARCAKILKQIDAVAEVQQPIRVGSCGTPAPVLLSSIGKKPAVVISPAATVTCEMAEALHKWIVTGLQPLARQHLGAPVVKITKMSDYSCRNAYGRARGRLSEHGRANALDIAGFETASGGSAMLLADWGMTERDIRNQIAAAKKENEKREAERMAAEVAARENARDTRHASGRAPNGLPPAAIGVASGAPGGGVVRSTIIEDGDGSREAVTLSIAGGNEATPVRTPLDGMIGRLGGHVPRSDVVTGSIVRQTGGVAVNAAAFQAGKARFLRGAHETACKIFGTVLGPEANNAHRNHLHIDMAERGVRGSFCE